MQGQGKNSLLDPLFPSLRQFRQFREGEGRLPVEVEKGCLVIAFAVFDAVVENVSNPSISRESATASFCRRLLVPFSSSAHFEQISERTKRKLGGASKAQLSSAALKRNTTITPKKCVELASAFHTFVSLWGDADTVVNSDEILVSLCGSCSS